MIIKLSSFLKAKGIAVSYVSVAIVKGGIKKPAHQVDAIAGATITSNGVTEMMTRGLAIYLPYFESLKK